MNKYNDQKPIMVSHFQSYGKNVKNKIMEIYQYDINLLELIFVPGIFMINCSAEK